MEHHGGDAGNLQTSHALHFDRGFLASCLTAGIYSYFAERLSEKVHATNPKGIVSGFEFTVDPSVCKKLGRFIFLAFEKRESRLLNIATVQLAFSV